jgi:hypothetical protein
VNHAAFSQKNDVYASLEDCQKDWDGSGAPRMLEYNAGTPTALLEAGVVQWHWLQDVHPEADQFNSLHEQLIYVRVTPYREFALIRSVNLATWRVRGAIALVVQVAGYGVARTLLPGIASGIPAGNVAHGVFLGALSLAVGILDAACMTW